MIFYITDVDFSNISVKIVPLILEKTNDGKSKIIGFLSKFKKPVTTGFAAGLKVLPQELKEDKLISMFKKNDGKIVDFVNLILTENKIPLSVQKIDIDRKETMEIYICLNEIDYAAFIKAAYELHKDKPFRNETFNKMFSVMNNLEGYMDDVIRASFQVLPQNVLDNMLSTAISVFGEEINNVINKKIVEHGITAKFLGVKAVVA
jgi:hypothetical protein